MSSGRQRKADQGSDDQGHQENNQVELPVWERFLSRDRLLEELLGGNRPGHHLAFLDVVLQAMGYSGEAAVGA